MNLSKMEAMVHGDSLKRVTEDDYGPRSSAYLGGGYKEDNFELTNVMIGEQRALGSVRVCSFFPPSNGEFHLSSIMALIWLSQLTTIYSCYDNGLTRKTEEVYIRNFHMKCRKRIVELNDILLECEITSKAVRNEVVHYRGNFDIDVGSFTGKASWFMPIRALLSG